MFPRLSKKCGRLLGAEVANHVLAHLNKANSSSASQNPANLTVNKNSIKFTDRQKTTISYLSGAVFKTIHKRLCESTSKSTEVKDKYFALLEAGKNEKL